MRSMTEQELEENFRFLVMYEPGPLSESFRGDIALVGCDREPVYAHRFILAGRSEVFKRMLGTDMKGDESSIVWIDEATAAVLRLMVNYCYTADIVFTDEAVAEGVLKVADKYRISGLRSKCLSQLSKNLRKDNILDRLLVAELYDDKNLKHLIGRFFAKNPSSVYSAVAKRVCKRKSVSSP